MALKPELIRRRKRIVLPRAPERPLGAKTEGLGQPVKIPNADALEKLLEELLYLAERETIFTMTLEIDRLIAALTYAGYCVPIYLNVEHQMAPGVTVTTYQAVPPEFVLIPSSLDVYGSLPWWITTYVWYDSDLPAAPFLFVLRSPPDFHKVERGIFPVFRFIRWTTTNNHVANTANFLSINNFAIMTRTAWNMLEEVYMKPIIEFAQEEAEKRTGRPYP